MSKKEQLYTLRFSVQMEQQLALAKATIDEERLSREIEEAINQADTRPLRGNAKTMKRLASMGGGAKKDGGRGVQGGIEMLLRHEEAKARKETLLDFILKD